MPLAVNEITTIIMCLKNTHFPVNFRLLCRFCFCTVQLSQIAVKMNKNFDQNEIVVYISDDQSGDLDVIHEITVQSANENNENDQPFPGKIAPGDFNIKLTADIAKLLIIEEKWGDFGEMVGKFNDDNVRALMKNETFLRMYLQYKMHLGHFQDIFHILEVFLFTNFTAHKCLFWSPGRTYLVL